MAIVLYINGLNEVIKPSSHIFTEGELLKPYNKAAKFKSCRLIEILNGWCLHEDIKNPVEDNLNKIASVIAGQQIYSTCMFIHDSEIDPSWDITDTLFENYTTFESVLIKSINSIAEQMLNQYNAWAQENNVLDSMPVLEPMGSTADKKILFNFNPNQQNVEFYKSPQFYTFSRKVYKFLKTKKKFKQDNNFVLYEDGKAALIVKPEFIPDIIKQMIDKFQSYEEYEICEDLTTIMNKIENTASKK